MCCCEAFPKGECPCALVAKRELEEFRLALEALARSEGRL